MTLNDYMIWKGLSRSEMAIKLGVSWQAVDYWLKRKRNPSFDRMRDITRTTEGHVTANDFYDLPEKPDGLGQGERV